MLIPRLRGSRGPLDDTLPGGVLEGVGVDPLVSAHHLLPSLSLRPSLRGKGACSSGKTPEQKLPPRDFNRPPRGAVLTGGCACERDGAAGQPPPPRLPRSYNLSGAEAED